MSPYPGGKHGPGHYISGNGAVAARIEVGAKIRLPQAPTLLPQPAFAGAGDRLFALISGTPGGFIGDATWFQLNSPAGSSFTVHTKVAAGNATDDASIDGFPGNTVTVGVKFAMIDIPGAGSWDFNAQGTIVNSLQLTFITGALNAFLIPKPSLSFYVGLRTFSPGNNGAAGPGIFSDVAFNGGPDGGVILADKTDFLLPVPFTMWHACNWNFQPLQITYPAGKFWSGADPGTLIGTATRGFRYNHDF